VRCRPGIVKDSEFEVSDRWRRCWVKVHVGAALAKQCKCGRWFTVRKGNRVLCFRCEEGQADAKH